MTSDMTSPTGTPGARNAMLADLAAMLRDQQARRVDIAAPASAIRAAGGQLVIDGIDHVECPPRHRPPPQGRGE